MFDELGAGELLAELRVDLRAERVALFRKHLAAGRLAQQRIAEHGDKDQWCIDGWEAVAAEVSAELGISRGRAGAVIHHGLTLLERLPHLAVVCLAGDVDFRVWSVIKFRTALILDPELLASIDTALARMAPQWNELSEEKLTALVDWLVADLDPEAQRVARRRDADRHVEIGPDHNGMAELWGSLRAADGAVLSKRLDELAATVCRDDPRTKAQRRADAMIALSDGATNLACECGTDTCPAVDNSDGTRSQVVIHVIAEAATVSGDGTKPGYLAGYGAVPATTVRELATRAKQRTVIQPNGSAPEPRYRHRRPWPSSSVVAT